MPQRGNPFSDHEHSLIGALRLGNVRAARSFISGQLSVMGIRSNSVLSTFFSAVLCPLRVISVIRGQTFDCGRAALGIRGLINYCVRTLTRRGVLHDLAFLHHERDALGGGDVGGGIAGDGDDVGKLALL